jgi:predicted PurR-regulated permease PerM
VHNHDDRTITQIEVPTRTIVRVIAVIVLLWLLRQLWDILLLGMIALMLTAALDPLVQRLQYRGLSRAWSVTVVMVTVILGVLGVVLIILSPILTEGQAFLEALPGQIDRLQGLFKDNPQLYERLRAAAENAAGGGSGAVTGNVKQVTFSILGFITDTLIVLTFTTYFLLDGNRIYRWTVRYVPARFRRKLDRTIPEVSKVVSGYVTGQLFTSLAFGIFSFAVLTLVGVPQPLFLALLAAVGDAIPIVGVTAVTIPTVLLALTISPSAAIIVLVAYLVYQQIENYFIVPRIYQSTLQISSFAVLLAVLIGAALLGIVGALLALPIAAAIPVIEDIWLEDSPLRANLPPPPPEPIEKAA